MTLNDCISEIKAIEPSAYSDQQLARWVMRADDSIATVIYLMQPEDVSRPDLTANSGDYSFPLLAPSPFDKLYPLYLHAMIHYANSEYDRYQNDMELYNEAYGEFARWFAAEYEPALTADRRAWFYDIRLEPGESEEHDVEIRDVMRGLLSPITVSNDGLSGTVTVSCGGVTLLDYDSADGGDAKMAYYAPEGGINVHYDLANGGSEAKILRISGRHYRYGWPDRFGRRA